MKTRRAYRHDGVGDALAKPPLAQPMESQVRHFRLLRDRQWRFCPDATVPCGLEIVVRYPNGNGVDNYMAEIVECGEEHCSVRYRLDDGTMSEAMT